jgi:hypothetical protein
VESYSSRGPVTHCGSACEGKALDVRTFRPIAWSPDLLLSVLLRAMITNGDLGGTMLGCLTLERPRKRQLAVQCAQGSNTPWTCRCVYVQGCVDHEHDSVLLYWRGSSITSKRGEVAMRLPHGG